MSFINALPWAVGSLLAFLPLATQSAPGELSPWINAGVAGIAVLLILKAFPMVLTHMENINSRHNDTMEKISQRHEDTVRDIVSRNEKKDEAWQQIVSKRGVCPMKEEPSNPVNP